MNWNKIGITTDDGEIVNAQKPVILVAVQFTLVQVLAHLLTPKTEMSTDSEPSINTSVSTRSRYRLSTHSGNKKKISI